MTNDEAWIGADADVCLLYTSDAADERSSVDLGGRRIIKKKTEKSSVGRSTWHTKITLTSEIEEEVE